MSTTNIITPKDAVSQICLLMKQDYEAVGFLARGAVEQSLEREQVILQQEGREIYGYLIHGPIRPGHRVVVKQTLVDMDARRLKAGERMFFALIDRAVKGMAVGINLRVAEGLPSNLFWQAVGCRLVNVVDPHNTRRRKINVYEFNLTDTFTAPSDMRKLWLPPSMETRG